MDNKIQYKLENKLLTVGNDLFTTTFADIKSVSAKISNNNKLSKPFLEISAERENEKHTYCIWEDLPVVYMNNYCEKELIKLKGEHWIVRSVKLHAFTDENDTLTEENEYNLFQMDMKPLQGEIFFLENPQESNAIIIISETPDYQTATLTINKGVVTVENGNNNLAIGYCKMGECEALCREFYRHIKKNEKLFTMSNTWGDCNGFSRVCQDFVLKEIDAAKEIGVDIVQVDDGWQKGNTADRTLRDEFDRRIFKGDFWELDSTKFPNGMKFVTEYAEKDNIKVGMWFAPDSHDEFALLERDKAVLRKAYEEWGIRFFKLDMFWVSSDKDRDQFLELLREIYSFGDDVAVQLDVTRDLRMNYLCGHKYGSVFVENRYAKSANSFPHRVLRNMWMISKYIPTSKFQFELTNPDLYKECYAETDPFVPSLYDMDYLFATVMLSNPLFWMEMQFLSDERKAQLKEIMDVWKKNRDILANADIMPIGDKPNGRSFTGFYISTNKEPQYLLLFREVTEENSAMIKCPVKTAKTEILASNSEVKTEIINGFVTVEFAKQRSYAFIKLS